MLLQYGNTAILRESSVFYDSTNRMTLLSKRAKFISAAVNAEWEVTSKSVTTDFSMQSKYLGSSFKSANSWKPHSPQEKWAHSLHTPSHTLQGSDEGDA